MNEVSYKKEEQYSLLTMEVAKVFRDNMKHLRSVLVTAMETGDVNFVLNFEKITEFDPSLYVKLDEINHIVNKENGILVVACFQAGSEELLKDLDIVSTKTLSEASDYIFMEEIERHFLADEEEETTDEAGIE